MKKYILGIETTCDETSAAVVQDDRIVLSNIIASQAKLHEKYGGVVPEVASRKHFEMLPTVTQEALNESGITIDQVEAVAIAKSPGLPPALSVGYAYASGLALSQEKLFLEVDHLEAHVKGVWLTRDPKKLLEIPYPYICLLVSGGHTEIRMVTAKNKYKILGKTRDDAAGEAFDKTARMLELGYPGGPIIDKLSQTADEEYITFPRPMIDSEDFDFSFSGLKTAVLRESKTALKEYEQYEDQEELYEELSQNRIADLSASFQEAVVDVLVSKTIQAASILGIEHVTIAGGVSANTRLREKMGRECHKKNFSLYYPDMEFCLDNAAMIASKGFDMVAMKKNSG